MTNCLEVLRKHKTEFSLPLICPRLLLLFDRVCVQYVLNIFIGYYTYIPLDRVRYGRHACYFNVYYSGTVCQREKLYMSFYLIASDKSVVITA